MISTNSSEIDGVVLSKSQIQVDFRGKFVKLESHTNFCNSLTTIALSMNPRVGTVRGMHFQTEPYSEEKSVSCIQGAIYDVVIDIRPNSKTFGQWRTYELTEENGLELHLPKGVAHGFQTLSPDSIVHYVLTNSYSSDHSFAINPFGDLQILWPLEVSVVSERDSLGMSFQLAAQKYADSLGNN